MNIKELYNKIQKELADDLSGELDLHKNHIIYKYDLSIDDDQYTEYDDEDNYYGFDSISDEESLNEVCDEDLDIINGYLDEIDEFDNFNISDPEIKKSVIFFKIFQNE
jgi:hypothetical protein